MAKLEVDIEALAVMSVVWPVAAAVENAELEVADELAAEVVIGAVVTKFEVDNVVAVAVGVSVEKFVEEFVAE